MPDDFARQLAQDLDANDVRQVLDVFDADIARLRDTLLSLSGAGNTPGFKRAAHQMAGAAAALGATRLETTARRAMSDEGLSAVMLPAIASEIAELSSQALGMSRELRKQLG